MNAVKILAIVLIVAGILGLLYGKILGKLFFHFGIKQTYSKLD